MTTPIAIAKSKLRAETRARVVELSSVARAQSSQAICARTLAMKPWQTAGSVLLYSPLADEPDVSPLLEQALAAQKIVALPSFVPGTGAYVARRINDAARDLVVGKFGIREGADHCPEISLKHLDLVLVPGVAFDARGGRLGRGKGFYDRLLADVRGTKCGVAFDEQIVAAVPLEPLDILLNCILTPTRWIET